MHRIIGSGNNTAIAAPGESTSATKSVASSASEAANIAGEQASARRGGLRTNPRRTSKFELRSLAPSPFQRAAIMHQRCSIVGHVRCEAKRLQEKIVIMLQYMGCAAAIAPPSKCEVCARLTGFRAFSDRPAGAPYSPAAPSIYDLKLLLRFESECFASGPPDCPTTRSPSPHAACLPVDRHPSQFPPARTKSCRGDSSPNCARSPADAIMLTGRRVRRRRGGCRLAAFGRDAPAADLFRAGESRFLRRLDRRRAGMAVQPTVRRTTATWSI